MNFYAVLKSGLVSNSIFMMVLQATQLVVPLLLMPFVIKTFGIEAFGLLSFATAICMFLNVICDYGFNLTATRNVAVNTDNKAAINEIFNTVIFAKLFLLFVTGLGYFIAVFSIDKFYEFWLIYTLSFGIVIGNAIFPIWLYQGFQNFKVITFINIFLRVFFTALIFIVVENESDFYKVPLFISLSYIVPSVIIFFLAVKEYNISYSSPSFQKLKESYLDGWHIFISRIAVFSYTSINIVFLEMFTSTLVVGYYSVASRVVTAISTIVGMTNQVLFPYLSKVWQVGAGVYYKKLRHCTLALLVIMFNIMLLLQVFAPYIIKVLTGENLEMPTNILRILSLSLLLVPLGGLFTQSFVTQGCNSLVTRVTIATMVVNFVLVLSLTPIYYAYGMALVVFLVQTFQVITNLFYLSKLRGRALCVV